METPTYVRIKTWLDLIATTGIIVLCALLIWGIYARPMASAPGAAQVAPASNANRNPLPASPIQLMPNPANRGQLSAKVAVVEYSDFQCPYCGKFARETLPAIEKRYVDTGLVLFAFRNYPLTQIHPLALDAAKAASCAGRQGKFWEMHDQLFGHQADLSPTTVTESANHLGLRSPDFASCLSSTTDIASDESSGQQLSVSGTPTFFIGALRPDRTIAVTQRFSGALTVDQFSGAIDRALQATAAPK